jgi:hypothetical protein
MMLATPLEPELSVACVTPMSTYFIDYYDNHVLAEPAQIGWSINKGST